MAIRINGKNIGSDLDGRVGEKLWAERRRLLCADRLAIEIIDYF